MKKFKIDSKTEAVVSASMLLFVGVYGMMLDVRTENTLFPSIFPEYDDLGLEKNIKPWLQKENKLSSVWNLFIIIGLIFFFVELFELKMEKTIIEQWRERKNEKRK